MVTTDQTELIKYIRRLGPGMYGVEGFCCSGKTTLSRNIAKIIKAKVVSSDAHVAFRSNRASYTGQISKPLLEKSIKHAAKNNQFVLVEGICLRALLPYNLNIKAFIYVKRISQMGLWHDGLDLERYREGEDLPYSLEEPHLSAFRYHASWKYKPIIKAMFIYERREGS